jgi:uncharacterized protein (TIGR00255 family)
MTGFGRAGFAIGEENYTVEVRSLNHRYLDLKVRLSERFAPLEPKVRDAIKKGSSRGSFSLYVNAVSGPAGALELNLPLARKYVEAEMELKKELGLAGEVDVPLILRLKDILSTSAKEEDLEGDWECLGRGVREALGELLEMRGAEGEALKKDVLSRLVVVDGFIKDIEGRIPAVVESYRERVRAEMEKLLGDNVDEARLLTEAALFADRTDVAEEVVRFTSHIARMREYLELDEPVGRRLDFLCQELLREANTIASKSNDLGITHTVVEVKGELEKVREQVQNIE